MNVCPHCGLVDEEAPGFQPVELSLRLWALVFGAACVGYGCLIGLLIGFTSQSPGLVLLSGGTLFSMLFGHVWRVRSKERELMRYLASDESERVIPEDQQPLPRIALW